MGRYLILVAPAANRVFAGQSTELTAAELQICGRSVAGPIDVGTVTVAGIDYVGFELPGPITDDLLAVAGRLSATYALFERCDDLLRPVELITAERFADDLVTIPKYQGKTNEQFTRMLINVTAAAVTRAGDRPLSLLDPLCGRGTTLSVGLTLGYDVAGVELDRKAVEAYAAFLKSYFRRKRIKHKAELNPVRREGRSLGKRLQVEVRPAASERASELTVFTGDTRKSAALFGKRRFDLVVTDAPYGVAHASTGGPGDHSTRDRSPADLLTEAVPVWAGQLRSGGALGISWNTYGLSREDLISIVERAGLTALDDDHHRRLVHRVDSSINRDILVAAKPDRR